MPLLDEKRDSVRHRLTRKARCHSARGQVMDATMSDLSISGCRLLTSTTPFGVGEVISVRLAGLEGIAGHVRWLHSSMIGIRFEGLLHEPVLRHLACSPDPVESAR